MKVVRGPRHTKGMHALPDSWNKCALGPTLDIRSTAWSAFTALCSMGFILCIPQKYSISQYPFHRLLVSSFQVPILVCLFNKAHKTNDASSCWRNDCMMTWSHEILFIFMCWKLRIFIDICGSVTDKLMDWPTDKTNRPSYRDARRYLVRLIYLLGHLFAQK